MIFGKLPTHGDFVSRGLSAEERDVWDVALSASLQHAKEEKGDAFATLYASAPPWRFLREEGASWLAGSIVPSMDSAGRLFPLVTGRSVGSVEEGAVATNHCESAVFSAFEARWTVDQLAEALSAPMQSEEDTVEAEPNCWWVDGGKQAGIAPLVGSMPAGLILAMLHVAEASS